MKNNPYTGYYRSIHLGALWRLIKIIIVLFISVIFVKCAFYYCGETKYLLNQGSGKLIRKTAIFGYCHETIEYTKYIACYDDTSADNDEWILLTKNRPSLSHDLNRFIGRSKANIYPTLIFRIHDENIKYDRKAIKNLVVSRIKDNGYNAVEIMRLINESIYKDM